MERNRGGRPRHPDVLTPAEWRVLGALREGGTNAEIAGRLGLSLDTVKTHISNMLAKLELRDRRALAAWRPEERRGRLQAVFGIPAALAAIARPVAWVGIGTAAAAGVTVAVVAAVVAVAVLLVVVPGGGEPSEVVRAPLAPPEATSTPAPASTVAPTASATPAPTATPRPAAAAAPGACTQATLGVDPAREAGLAADCATLLASKDTLRGTATLDWSADTAMESWDGVSLEGNPSRVTGLNLEGRMLAGSIPARLGRLDALSTLALTGNQLTGAIPPELGDLRALTHVYLSGNALTGCVPRALRAVASNDIATLDLESCALPSVTLSYDTYDTTGAVTTAGSYAFLTEADDETMTAVTTYEGLRDGTTTALLIHTSDAGDAPQSGVYDLVETGDIFEWKQADDCLVRYKVMSTAQSAGEVSKRGFGVEWMTYAFTGCSGAVSTDASVSLTWGTLPDLGGASLTVPVIHGTFQLAPRAWTGAEMQRERLNPPSYSDINPVYTTSTAEARSLPYWRDPVLPAGWTFSEAFSGGESQPPYGYCATYLTERGGLGVEICAGHVSLRFALKAAATEAGRVTEARVIAGHPALVRYWIPTPTDQITNTPVKVWVYDAATNSSYTIRGIDPAVTGTKVDAVIAIARSMFAGE